MSDRYPARKIALVTGASSGIGEATAERLALAGYKVPRAWTFVDRVRRSPSGKADYGWAREAATAVTRPPF